MATNKKLMAGITTVLGLGCVLTGGGWLYNHQQIQQTQTAIRAAKHNRVKALQTQPQVKVDDQHLSQVRKRGQAVLSAQQQLINSDTKVFVPYVDNSQGWNPATTPWGYPGDHGELVIGTYDASNAARNVSFIYHNQQQQMTSLVTAQYQDGKFVNITLYQTDVGMHEQQQQQAKILQRSASQAQNNQ